MPAGPEERDGCPPRLILGLLSLPAVSTVTPAAVRTRPAGRHHRGSVGYRRAARSGEATNGGMAVGGTVLGVPGITVGAGLVTAVGVWGLVKFGGRDLRSTA